MVQAVVLGASAAFEKRSLAVHQRKVSEVVRVLAAGFQDAGAWYAAVVNDFAEAGIGFVGMEEVENHRMAHSGNSEAHSEIEVEARSERVGDHFEIDSEVRSEKMEAHSGTVEDRCGM